MQNIEALLLEQRNVATHAGVQLKELGDQIFCLWNEASVPLCHRMFHPRTELGRAHVLAHVYLPNAPKLDRVDR